VHVWLFLTASLGVLHYQLNATDLSWFGAAVFQQLTSPFCRLSSQRCPPELASEPTEGLMLFLTAWSSS